MKRHLIRALPVLTGAAAMAGLVAAYDTFSPKTFIAGVVTAIILAVVALVAAIATREPRGQHRKDALHALPAPPPQPEADEQVTEVLDVQPTFSQHATEVLAVVAPRTYGGAEVLPATVVGVDVLLNDVFHEWQEGPHGVTGVLVLTADGRMSLARLGDRIIRDADGVQVEPGQPARTENVSAYPDWETGEFAAVIAEAGAA